MTSKGIDVSTWQDDIDWIKVKNSDIQFAMIREGFGNDQPCQIDKHFKKNIKNAQSVGIHCGVYHYSYALSVDDAINEANFCLKNVKGYLLEYPIALDIEDNSMKKLGKQTLTNICKAFCSTIENAGYYVCIYTNTNWLKNYLNSSELLPKYDLWLAQWDSKLPIYKCGIWQYSDEGKIDGIAGNVDLNIAYKDYPTIMNKKKLNGFNNINNTVYHQVKKGDTLWSIAQKYLGNGNRYVDIKNTNNLQNDTIYVGQTLKIIK